MLVTKHASHQQFQSLGQDPPKVSSLQLAKAFPAKFWPLSQGHKLTEQLHWTDASQIWSSRSVSHSRLISHKNRNNKKKKCRKGEQEKDEPFLFTAENRYIGRLLPCIIRSAGIVRSRGERHLSWGTSASTQLTPAPARLILPTELR